MSVTSPLDHMGRCGPIGYDEEQESEEREFIYPLKEFEVIDEGHLVCSMDFWLVCHAVWSWGELSYVEVVDIYLDRELEHLIPSRGIWPELERIVRNWALGQHPQRDGHADLQKFASEKRELEPSHD